MFYINKRNARHGGSTQEDSAKERKRTVEEILTDELTGIINCRNGKKTYWRGSITDLMEAVYTAYMSGTVYDDMGQPCSFKQLVHSACLAMHVAEPTNPRSYIYRAQNRKGIRQEPFIQRYGRMLEGSDSGCPLAGMLEKR